MRRIISEDLIKEYDFLEEVLYIQREVKEKVEFDAFGDPIYDPTKADFLDDDLFNWR